MRKTFILLFLAPFTLHVNAQKTWQDIYNLMHTTCSTSSCHGSGAPNTVYNVDTPANVLYTQLVNADPLNPYAKDSLHHKLVDPGSPQTSFLMRKISHCLTGSLALVQPYEGEMMPKDADSLSTENQEMILQWILQGASETAVISPDTFAGNICDFGVGINTLSEEQLAFHILPNPVESDFSVSFTLKEAAVVTLELFDAKAANTNVLLEKKLNSGTYNETFNPALPAGIYYLRLTIDGKSFIRKLAVVQ